MEIWFPLDFYCSKLVQFYKNFHKKCILLSACDLNNNDVIVNLFFYLGKQLLDCSSCSSPDNVEGYLWYEVGC